MFFHRSSLNTSSGAAFSVQKGCLLCLSWASKQLTHCRGYGALAIVSYPLPLQSFLIQCTMTEPNPEKHTGDGGVAMDILTIKEGWNWKVWILLWLGYFPRYGGARPKFPSQGFRLTSPAAKGSALPSWAHSPVDVWEDTSQSCRWNLWAWELWSKKENNQKGTLPQRLAWPEYSAGMERPGWKYMFVRFERGGREGRQKSTFSLIVVKTDCYWHV